MLHPPRQPTVHVFRNRMGSNSLKFASQSRCTCPLLDAFIHSPYNTASMGGPRGNQTISPFLSVSFSLFFLLLRGATEDLHRLVNDQSSPTQQSVSTYLQQKEDALGKLFQVLYFVKCVVLIKQCCDMYQLFNASF